MDSTQHIYTYSASQSMVMHGANTICSVFLATHLYYSSTCYFLLFHMLFPKSSTCSLPFVTHYVSSLQYISIEYLSCIFSVSNIKSSSPLLSHFASEVYSRYCTQTSYFPIWNSTLHLFCPKRIGYSCNLTMPAFSCRNQMMMRVTRRTLMVVSLVTKLRPLRLSSVKLSLSLIEHFLIISQSVDKHPQALLPLTSNFVIYSSHTPRFYINCWC